MNINKLKEKLDIKIQQEYDKFIEKLMKLSPKEIIERSYEKIFKEEIISMIQGKELSKSEIIALLKVDYPLDALYQEWLKIDLTIIVYIVVL
ncbi:MAG: DUF3848 domain-containing protein [Erysipelotrichaceae bacterium]|nr:DUF3848 domain-containing protein [Erysipelotrichaceae bacterium]